MGIQKYVVWYCCGYESRAMKSLCSGVWSRIIADKYLQNRHSSECLCSFYQKEYNIRGLVKVLPWVLCGLLWTVGNGHWVLDHLTPELIAGLNAQGIT